MASVNCGEDFSEYARRRGIEVSSPAFTALKPVYQRIQALLTVKEVTLPSTQGLKIEKLRPLMAIAKKLQLVTGNITFQGNQGASAFIGDVSVAVDRELGQATLEFERTLRELSPSQEIPSQVIVQMQGARFTKSVLQIASPNARQTVGADSVMDGGDVDGGDVDFGDEGEPVTFDSWISESEKRWMEVTRDRYPAEDELISPQSYFQVAFRLADEVVFPGLAELRDVASRVVKIHYGHAGWYLPPGPKTSLWTSDYAIDCVPFPQSRMEPSNVEFWRLSRLGEGFLLRGHEEDTSLYDGREHGGPKLDLPITLRRAAQLILQSATLGEGIAGRSVAMEMDLRWTGLSGRHAAAWQNLEIPIVRKYPARRDEIRLRVNFRSGGVRDNLVPLLASVARKFSDTFDFINIPDSAVQFAVRDVLEERE